MINGTEYNLISAINKVGVNVNQIAKAINESKVTGHPIAIEESTRVLSAVLDQLLIIAKKVK